MKYIYYATIVLCAILIGFGGVADAAEDNLVANNVVIVLDASGSMSQFMHDSRVVKMQAAKNALKEVLENVPADTQIGLLVFSGNNTNAWRFPLGPRDDARIKQAIDQSMPGGGTPLGEYIQKAAIALQNQRKKQMGYGTYRMLIVTDGEASDSGRMNYAVPQALRGGIRVDVIGVDMKDRHTLATMVHSYRRADDPQSLKKAVADVFAEVGGKGGGASSADAFAEIASIPTDTAGKMLLALSIPAKIEMKNSPSMIANPVSASAPVKSFPVSSSNNFVGEKPFQWKYIIALAVIFIIVVRKVTKK